ncbi:MAG TPA: hypothetical protein HA263_08105 [Methanoregulaceae archaeon]|nr:hypothetical protein [Methanoregulaceae archaeon]
MTEADDIAKLLAAGSLDAEIEALVGPCCPVGIDARPMPSEETISPRMLRRARKMKAISAMKREALADVMPTLPEPGYSYHIVSNGAFDYWSWIPVMAGYMGHVAEFYGSTWTLNRLNAAELLGLIDAGTVATASVITGLYFRRREPAVYSLLHTGMAERGMRCVGIENHAKVALLGNAETDTWIVVEGSANWTANPRIEQNVVSNDRELFEFHRGWMEEAIGRTCAGRAAPLF